MFIQSIPALPDLNSQLTTSYYPQTNDEMQRYSRVLKNFSMAYLIDQRKDVDR